jgi:hypothetical protein
MRIASPAHTALALAVLALGAAVGPAARGAAPRTLPLGIAGTPEIEHDPAQILTTLSNEPLNATDAVQALLPLSDDVVGNPRPLRPALRPEFDAAQPARLP